MMQSPLPWVLFVAVVTVSGYPKFKDEIPNGHGVPDPCYYVTPGAEQIWGGVGHKKIDGGGDLNLFGAAFKANNYTYTVALCQLDSDSDGLTNGQELGDPYCLWKKGGVTVHGPRGHPGICEPVGSQWCNNSWFNCSKF